MYERNLTTVFIPAFSKYHWIVAQGISRGAIISDKVTFIGVVLIVSNKPLGKETTAHLNQSIRRGSTGKVHCQPGSWLINWDACGTRTVE